MSTLNIPVQRYPGSLSQYSTSIKRKDTEFGKAEIKLSLFTDDMIVNVEKPKESTQKTNQQKLILTNVNLARF